LPIYEYRCGACARSFERLVRASAESVSCAACGSTEVERVLSLSAVRSEQTRSRAKQDLKARNRATRRAQDDAEVRRIQSHSEDHAE
jgi:putative FmdB family regulatory protein